MKASALGITRAPARRLRRAAERVSPAPPRAPLIPSAMAIAVLLTGCECSEEPAGRSDLGRAVLSAGGDQTEDGSHGPAIVLRTPGEAVPEPARFEPIAPALATGSTRARGWASLDDLQSGASERLSLGNWLCRIWAHYGPPPEVQDGGFAYAFRDRETGEVITAYSASSGPAMGGMLLGQNGVPVEDAQQRITASVNAFVSLIDSTAPPDCELELQSDYGPIRVGVRDGEWFEHDLEP